MTPRTELVTLSWANGLTGVINPLHDIAHLCDERGVQLHLEASHVIGKLRFDLNSINPNFLTFGGEAVKVPCSSGVLLVRKGTKPPMIDNTLFDNAKLAALAKGAEETIDALDLVLIETARLRNRFEKLICEGVQEAKVLFQSSKRVPHITAIAFPGIFNEALLFRLHHRGVYATIGGGKFQQIALVLQACHIDEELANSTISFSLSRETTVADIEKAAAIIIEEVKALWVCKSC